MVQEPVAAVERAREALSDIDDDVEITALPFRTTGTWVVMAEGADAGYNVHIDATDGSTRIAKIDR